MSLDQTAVVAMDTHLALGIQRLPLLPLRVDQQLNRPGRDRLADGRRNSRAVARSGQRAGIGDGQVERGGPLLLVSLRCADLDAVRGDDIGVERSSKFG
jgi:hypothetical protein